MTGRSSSEPDGERAAPPPGWPAPLTSFVAREREVADVRALLRRPGARLVTLTGPGGVGKTRLALRVGETLRGEFAGDVVLVRLAAITDPALVGPTIARALELGEPGGRPIVDVLAAALRDRRLLLVLDNFEQVVDAAPLLAELLSACPALTMLVTSRALLRISGEQDYPVLPLDVSGPSDDGDTPAAVQLFVERARAADPAFLPVNAATLVAICERLDGLPLAIELAAAKARLLPPDTLLARLEHRLPLLTGGVRDQPARLRTMRGAIAWSYDLLHTEEQILFTRLSAFTGGFTIDAAEAVAGSWMMGDGGGPRSHDPSPSVLDGIESLAEQSLIRRSTAPTAEPRFGMLETVREFGSERLTASDEEAAVRRCHAAFFLNLAERAAPAWSGSEPATWLDRLEADRDNLRSALAWADRAGERETAARLATALWWFWRIRGPVSEGRHWIEQILAAFPSEPSRLRVQLLMAAADLARVEGDLPTAEPRYRESIDVARQSGDLVLTAFPHLMLGGVAAQRGEQSLAEEYFERALALSRELGDLHVIAATYDTIASVRRRHGDLDAAWELLQTADAFCRERGLAWDGAAVVSHLADVAADRGDHARAAALYRESLRQLWALGERRNVLGAVAGFAQLLATTGDAPFATRLCGAVDRLLREMAVALPPFGQTSYERAVVLARARLDEAAFAAAWSAGAGLTVEQVMAEIEADRAPAASRIDPAERFGLTRRELEVLRLLPSGETYRQIGERLFVTHRTVEHHVQSLCAKLGVTGREDAVATARRLGLLEESG